MKTFTEELESYNDALRYAEEEDRQRANGAWVSAAKWKPWKNQSILLIKARVNEEFAAIEDFLNGKIKEPKTVRMIGNLRYDEECYYFANPFMYEGDIVALDDDLGELSETDLAWIKNTRESINKYHAIVYQEGGFEESEAA